MSRESRGHDSLETYREKIAVAGDENDVIRESVSRERTRATKELASDIHVRRTLLSNWPRLVRTE